MSTGRIEKALSGFYYVNVGGVLRTCRARGKFRRAGMSPLVGDWVEVLELDGGEGMVEKILERQNDPTEEIERTAMNIVRLLNTMREYQFRENLIRSLKAQIEQKKQLNEEVQDLVKKVRDTVQSSLQDLHASPQAPAEGQPLPEGVAKQTRGKGERG